MKHTVALCFYIAGLVGAAGSSNLRTKKNLFNSESEYVILEKHVQCDNGNGNGAPCQENKGRRQWAVEVPGTGILDIEGGLTEEEEAQVESGRTRVKGAGVTVIPGQSKAQFANRRPTFVNPPGPPGRKLAATGEKSVLVVRAVADDTSTTADEAELSDSVFGTSGDPVNLKSQYEACSHGQFLVEKATDPGNEIGGDGVLTVTIGNTVSGAENSVIRDAMVSAGNALLGNMQSKYDHVMLCIPPGTKGGWIAYAYVNWYLSVYNNEWCTYVSGQMHEIGHNLDLAHSGEGTNQYDDQSGMMGYSYGNSDAPRMCFNAVQNWKLGWYADRHETVSTSWSGSLYGISDYGTTSFSEKMIIRIPGPGGDGSEDYYVSFNRKDVSGTINSGTAEGGNQVLVHKRKSGTGYEQSWLMAKLGMGGTYAGAPLSITVNSISLSGTAFAHVTIGNTPAPTPSPTPAAPTPSPTPTPLECSCSPLPKRRGICQIKNGCSWSRSSKRCVGTYTDGCTAAGQQSLSQAPGKPTGGACVADDECASGKCRRDGTCK